MIKMEPEGVSWVIEKQKLMYLPYHRLNLKEISMICSIVISKANLVCINNSIRQKSQFLEIK